MVNRNRKILTPEQQAKRVAARKMRKKRGVKKTGIPAQMSHASSGRSDKKRREGQGRADKDRRDTP